MWLASAHLFARMRHRVQQTQRQVLFYAKRASFPGKNARNVNAPNAARRSPPAPPPRLRSRGASESRLLAPGRVAHLPGLPDQWCYERALMPDTVAGPRRLSTGFRGSLSRFDYKSKLAALERACKHDD